MPPCPAASPLRTDPLDPKCVASPSAALRAWSRDETVREVRVDGESFADAQLFHDDEAQTIPSAVRLILVPLEAVEGRSLLIESGPVDARQPFAVELFTQPGGLFVPDLTSQCDRFGDDVIRGEQMIDKSQIPEGSEDVDDSPMVNVSLRDEREEEPRIEEDHIFGRP